MNNFFDIKESSQLKIEAVLYFHVAWILFLYAAWPGIFFSKNFNIFFFLFAFITLLARMLFKGDCILTNIENDLRRKHAPHTVYNDTDRCIPYYSEKWLGFRIKKPVIFSAFAFVFLLSLGNLLYTFHIL